MFSSILLSTIWFEFGSWFGFSLAKFGSRERNQNILINGSDSRTSIPVADAHIEKQTIGATKTQRIIARRLAQLIRAFTNTKAFELIVLQKVQEYRAPKDLDSEVRLFV